jgi:DNA repair protein RadA/Sms
MAKQKSAWFCQECGVQSPKWQGKCSSCGSWNTYVEELIPATGGGGGVKAAGNPGRVSPQLITDITPRAEERRKINDGELNRVLGGGVVPGSVILLGGEPGIGKSTLLLQLALRTTGLKTLYVSGEESDQQIRMRAQRTGTNGGECYILTETLTANILHHAGSLMPDLIIIDSIQTLQSDLIDSVAGSVGQIRQCTMELQQFAKQHHIPLLLIGHITKDGHIAGPKVLEHMVDVVLLFEGDRNYGFRLLRALKNRFGSTGELGIYAMKSAGLEEVTNPSELLLSSHEEDYSGSAVAVTLEGARPLLIEVQSLVSSAVYGTPQRSGNGFDIRRMNMLLAVLEKRCGFRLGTKDVFLNITGGIRVDDPATDLAVVGAILSSNADIAIRQGVCFAAEIGLTGEIRPVTRIEERIGEAARLGFGQIFISKNNLKGLRKNPGINTIGVATVEQLAQQLFG